MKQKSQIAVNRLLMAPYSLHTLKEKDVNRHNFVMHSSNLKIKFYAYLKRLYKLKL